MHNDCRSNIAIQTAPTFTMVLSRRKQLRFDRAAAWAGLTCSARINLDEFSTSVCSFVPKVRDDLCPCGVVNVLGQEAPSQTFNVELFHSDFSKPLNEVSGQLVTKVTTLGDYTHVIAGQCRYALPSSRRPSLASRDSSIAFPKTALRAFSPVGPRNSLTIAQRDKTDQAHIDADATRRRSFHGRNVNMEHDIPLSCLLREDRGFRFTGKLAMPPHADLSGHANDTDFPTLPKCQAVTDAKFSRVITRSGSEPRKPWRIALVQSPKERAERLVETPQHLLLRRTRPATMLVRQIAPDSRQTGDLFVRTYLSSFCEGVVPMFERRVIELAKVSEHFAEQNSLLLGRLYSKFVAQNHLTNLAEVRAFGIQILGGKDHG